MSNETVLFELAGHPLEDYPEIHPGVYLGVRRSGEKVVVVRRTTRDGKPSPYPFSTVGVETGYSAPCNQAGSITRHVSDPMDLLGPYQCPVTRAGRVVLLDRADVTGRYGFKRTTLKVAYNGSTVFLQEIWRDQNGESYRWGLAFCAGGTLTALEASGLDLYATPSVLLMDWTCQQVEDCAKQASHTSQNSQPL